MLKLPALSTEKHGKALPFSVITLLLLSLATPEAVLDGMTEINLSVSVELVEP